MAVLLSLQFAPVPADQVSAMALSLAAMLRAFSGIEAQPMRGNLALSGG